MSPEALMFTFITLLIGGGIFLGVRMMIKTGSAHRALKEQMKNRYGLRAGKFSSLENAAGCRLWFKLPGREYVMGVAALGSDTIKHPTYSAVALSQPQESRMKRDFLILNRNKATERCSFFPFKQYKELPLSKDCSDKFLLFAKGEKLSDTECAEFAALITSLHTVLENATRYEIGYRSGEATVYLACHTIEDFETLATEYETAQRCLEILRGQLQATRQEARQAA